MENYSYSKIDTYDQCPFRFKLQYRDGHYPQVSNAAIAFGILVHKIFELQTSALMSGQKVNYDQLKDYFLNVNIPKKNARDREGDIFGAEILSKRFEKEWGVEDKTGKTYFDKTQDFLNAGIYRLENYLNENPDLKLVGAEIPFEFEYRKYKFKGFIDRVLQYKTDPKHFVVHDIKTSAKAYDDKKCVSPMQMAIYVRALREQYGEDIKVDCFYEFPVANEMKAAGTKGFEARCMRKLNALLDSIEAHEWEPNPSPLCYWCAFSNTNPDQPPACRNLCPYYSLYRPGKSTFDTKLPWLGIDKHEEQVKKLLEIEAMEGQSNGDPSKFEFYF